MLAKSMLQLVVVLWLAVTFFVAPKAFAQTILRVDGIAGADTPAGQGNGWCSNAYQYLADAIDQADFLLDNQLATSVQIWVRGEPGGLSYLSR
jgi:hypothetical protein